MSRKRTGRFWPTRLQERLLVAALGDPAGAVAAWRDVRPRFSLDDMEPGSFELMPLIYRNLSSAGSEDDLLPRLKGIYRRTWVRNNLLVERTQEIASALLEADVPALFLEGVTVALRYYPDLGARPTTYVHVLVAPRDEATALGRLAHAGWVERPDSGAYPGWRFLFDGAGNVAVLRSSLAFDFGAPDPAGSEDPLWEAAEQLQDAAAEIRVPSRTDMLLAVCVAGARLGPVPSTQWLADAAMVLRGGEIDWDRLLAVGLARGQAIRLREALRYLRRLPVPPPPAEVSARLDRAGVGARERLTYALASGSLRGLGALPETVAAHLAATREQTLARSLASSAGRLRERWDLEHGWQLPLAAGRRLLRLGARRPA